MSGVRHSQGNSCPAIFSRGPHPHTIRSVHIVPLPIDGEGEFVGARSRGGVRSNGRQGGAAGELFDGESLTSGRPIAQTRQDREVLHRCHVAGDLGPRRNLLQYPPHDLA